MDRLSRRRTAALQSEVRAFLDRYHDHRPHLGFTPMRPPLAPSHEGQDGLSDIYKNGAERMEILGRVINYAR